MAEKTTEAKQGSLARSDPREVSGRRPGLLDRFADEMDRLFDDFGLSRSRLGRGWFNVPFRGAELWTPEIDVYQRSNELVVRADLPGLKKEDVSVDVTDGGIILSGERRHEEETERGGVYRSERSYGSFYRVIPLPEGAITDQAKASFKNGVLEITVPAPPEQVTRGRRLEISEGSESRK
jgi:HSP20 family protein